MMGKFSLALLTVWVLTLGVVAQAVAFEGGGRKPSEAPLIAFGQHYTGQLNNHRDDANYEASREVAIWRLPPVSTRDQIVVNWHVLPFTSESGFPVCLTFVQGVDDFSWGGVFGDATQYRSCDEGGPLYSVSGSGAAQTAITVQNTDASASYLEFFSRASQTNPSFYETYPYDFSVQPPRHFLGLALKAKSKVHANGAIRGAVTLASGLPAPDGLPFSLTVTWGRDGIAAYSATTAGGQVVFPLALPESAVNKNATFLITHGADASYQEASARIDAEVTPAVASASEIACSKATQKAHALARQVKRLKRNARFAQGAAKRRLKRRARHVGKEWSAARARAKAACG
jgi:hypothetical protein